jgi:hypothetical protein
MASDVQLGAPVLDNGSLHYAILRGFVDSLRPPTVRELVHQFHQSDGVVRQALRALAEYHGSVLHPHSDEIWVTHPFSAAPTTCVVAAAGRQWWGNCPWCSFGIAHLVGGTGSVTTTIGALGDQVVLRFKNHALLDTNFVVHFPVPMAKVWDNVIYTCSVMLLFRNVQEVDDWCAARGFTRGDVRPVEQVWRFAAEWYGRHLDAHWQKWTVTEAAAIFRKHGLGGQIWTLPETGGRF